MAFSSCVFTVAAFLSAMVALVFVMLVIGIHRGDRARHLSDAPETVLDAATRKFLGVGIRHGHREEN